MSTSHSATAPDQNKLSPLQLLIKETLDIPDHMTTPIAKGDIRMAYNRYLAVADAQKRLSKLANDGIWTQKWPTLAEIVGLFAGKTTYFNNSPLFAKVPNFPQLEKWMLNEEDAPSDGALWGSTRPTFSKLKELVGAEEKAKNKKKKGKKHEEDYLSEAEEKVTDKKGKGKQKRDSGKKGGSSKSSRL